MSTLYAYKYARIRISDGICRGVDDSTEYILSPEYVPIEDDTIDYYRKYYYPIPATATSFDDFQGRWYLDAAHTQEFVEGNAYIDNAN